VRRTALLAAKIGVSVALLAYLLSDTNLQALYHRVRTGDTLLFGLAVAGYGGMLAMSTWRWHLLLRTQGYPASLRRLSETYLVAMFFNNFLPSNIGGDIVRVRDSSRLTGSTTASVAVVAIDRILGFGALYFLALLAFALGGASLRRLAGARTIVVVVGVVFAGLVYVFFRPGTARRLVAASRLASIPWFRERFETVQGAVHVYRAELGSVVLAFGASVGLQSLMVLYYFVIAHALRIPLSLPACFLMVPLCTLIQTIPVSFNGWGIRESVFALYFTQVGLPRESALAFSLVGAGLIVLLSLSGAVVWAARGEPPPPEAESA
jgi:uncharacterized protein (TIRG00374 family)